MRKDDERNISAGQGEQEAQPAFPYVSRDAELRVLDENLRKPGSRILEVRGTKGMGKTALLHEFARHCAREKIPYAYIDLTDEVINGTDLPMSALRAWHETGNIDNAEYFNVADDVMLELLREYPGLEYWKDNNGTGDINFSDRLFAAYDYYFQQSVGMSGKKLVLLLDNGSRDYDQADFAENFLVEPLLGTNRLLAVSASEFPWQWKRPEAARKMEGALELVGIDVEATEQLLASQVTTDIAKEYAPQVWDITKGMPATTCIAASVLRGIPQQEIDSDTLLRNVLAAIDTQYTNRQVFGSVSTQAREVGYLLSHGGIYDIRLIRHMAKAVQGADIDWGDAQDLSLELRRAGCITWDEEHKYKVRPDYARLMAAYQRAATPDVFSAIHTAVLGYYETILRKENLDPLLRSVLEASKTKFTERLVNPDPWAILHED